MIDLINAIGLFWFLFGLAVFILWALLPFAVFGIKKRLDRLAEESERTNALLVQLINAIQSQDRPNWPH